MNSSAQAAGVLPASHGPIRMQSTVRQSGGESKRRLLRRPGRATMGLKGPAPGRVKWEVSAWARQATSQFDFDPDMALSVVDFTYG
jgi:hypothetical protein